MLQSKSLNPAAGSATVRSAGHLLSFLCSECGLSPESPSAQVWFWPLDGDTVLGDGTWDLTGRGGSLEASLGGRTAAWSY